MNIKQVLVGVGVGAVVLVVYSVLVYNWGRSSMRNEILASPADTQSVDVPSVFPVKPETLAGRGPAAGIPENRVRMPQAPRPSQGQDEPAGVDVIDEGGGPALAYTYRDTLTDRRGGRHALLFDVPSLVFGEVYDPPDDTVRVRTVTVTRFVEKAPPDFWVDLSGSSRSAAGSLGWRFIGVGISYIRGVDNRWDFVAPVITLHHHF